MGLLISRRGSNPRWKLCCFDKSDAALRLGGGTAKMVRRGCVLCGADQFGDCDKERRNGLEGRFGRESREARRARAPASPSPGECRKHERPGQTKKCRQYLVQ